MQDSLPAGGVRLYREGVEPSGPLRKVSGHISLLPSRTCPVASGICSKSYAKEGRPKTLAIWRFTPFDFASVFLCDFGGSATSRRDGKAVALGTPGDEVSSRVSLGALASDCWYFDEREHFDLGPYRAEISNRRRRAATPRFSGERPPRPDRWDSRAGDCSSPYIAAYFVTADRVRILRILHGAQVWPGDIEKS